MMTSSIYAGLKVADVRKPAVGNETAHFPTWLHSDTHSDTKTVREIHANINRKPHPHRHPCAETNTHLFGVFAEWQDLA